MKKIQIIKFLNIAAVLLIGHEIAQGMLSQSINYQSYIVTPSAIVEDSISNIFNKNEKEIQVTEQYKQWLKENIEYIKEVNVNNELFNKNIDKLPVILKNGNNFWDKLSVLFLHTFYSKNKNYNHSLSTANGYNNSLDIDLLNESHPYTLFVGTKILDKKNQFSKNILQVFNNNKKLAFDYIVLHELSHFISFTVLDDDNQTELEVRNAILNTFFMQQNLKENDYTDKDKENIVTQYSESIADSLAMQLMLKKHPELKNEKQILYNLAKLRLKENEITHISTVSLLQLDKVLKKKNYKIGSIDEMLSISKECALFTVQYFSDNTEEKPLFSNRETSVSFKLTGYKEETILNEINLLYAQIEKSQTKSIK